MWKVKKTLLIFLICLLTSAAWSQKNEKPLSLDECIKTALRNNLGVAVEIINPEIAETRISLAREHFLPQLSMRYFTQNTNTPAFSWIDATDQVTTEYNNYAARFTQIFPTGTNISATLFSYQNDTNQKFQTINPRFGSTLQFSVTQPLLKNFGFRVNRREIIIAKNNKEMSDSQLKQVLLDTVYSVEEAYWNLVFSIEDLRVRQQSLELARDLLRKNKKEVDVGTLAPIEILSAEAEVATREADILQAEAAVKNNEDILKTVINLDQEAAGSLLKVVPKDTPSYTQTEITLDEALKTAMENRPDLKSLRWDIKSRDVDFVYAKNQLLPDLSLEASYWSPGISGTQILYKDNNPLTNVIVGTIPGGASDALKDALKFRYQNWSAGITLTLPTNTVFTRAKYAQAKMSFEQAKLRLKNQEQQVFLEVSNAVRAVQTDFKRIQAYKVARELAEKKLEAEEKKLKVGLTTNYLVLQYQRDLATARSAELRAIIDYNLSLARLNKAMGVGIQER
ncbi:MAG: TolC family protein [Candidatus Aminicenantes bacterium]